MTEQTTPTVPNVSAELAAAAAAQRVRSLTGGFWASVDGALQLIRDHRPDTFDGVKLALDADEYNAGDKGPDAAFFGGSGGDASLEAALRAAGWSTMWAEADYHWVMRSPAGEWVTYTEGDVNRGICAYGAADEMLTEARDWLNYYTAEGDTETAARHAAALAALVEPCREAFRKEADGCDRLAAYYRARERTAEVEEHETRAAALRLKADTLTAS